MLGCVAEILDLFVKEGISGLPSQFLVMGSIPAEEPEISRKDVPMAATKQKGFFLTRAGTSAWTGYPSSALKLGCSMLT